MEPFLPGEPVTRTDLDHALGHILDVDEVAGTAEVRWLRRPGHDHEITIEPMGALRRIHESDEDSV